LFAKGLFYPKNIYDHRFINFYLATVHEKGAAVKTVTFHKEHLKARFIPSIRVPAVEMKFLSGDGGRVRLY